MEGHPTIENVVKAIPSTGGWDGGGWGGGGGLLGLVALLTLLNRGGLGAQGGEAAGTIMQSLSDLRAQVPLSACETQGQVVASANDTNSQILQQTLALTAQGNRNQLTTVSGISALADKISGGFAAGALATANAQYAITQSVNEDGDKTRALIQSIDKANDSRLITAQANEIVELRQEQRRQADRHGIEISMTNNQNQNQLQLQQQQQSINALLSELVQVGQLARATNQQLIIGNQGVATGGAQTANPTNVKA